MQISPFVPQKMLIISFVLVDALHGFGWYWYKVGFVQPLVVTSFVEQRRVSRDVGLDLYI